MQKLIKSDSQVEQYFEERCFITEIINDETLPGLSIARARVLPGITTILHSLSPSIEIYYILQGEGEMEIDGSITGRVKTGDTIYIPAGESQRIKNCGDGDLIFLCVCNPRFSVEQYKTLETAVIH